MVNDTYHTQSSNLDISSDEPAFDSTHRRRFILFCFGTLSLDALYLARTVRNGPDFRIIFGPPDDSALLSEPLYPGRSGHLFSDPSMQLTECGIGETARVVAVMGCERFRSRLALRGIAPGRTCTVVSAACGPIVLAVDGGTVAIGRRMAAHITVERNPDEKSNY